MIFILLDTPLVVRDAERARKSSHNQFLTMDLQLEQNKVCDPRKTSGGGRLGVRSTGGASVGFIRAYRAIGKRVNGGKVVGQVQCHNSFSPTNTLISAC